jgi:hypothetical protein
MVQIKQFIWYLVCRFNSDWVNDFYLRDNHENIEDLLSDECFIIIGMNR